MSARRLRAYLILVITASIWGFAGPIIKFTLGGLAALPFLTYRLSLSSVAALVTSGGRPIKVPKKREVALELFAFGFITSTVTLSLLFFGLSRTTLLDSILIGAAGPLLVTIAGAKYLHDTVTKREKMGMGIVFSGVAITVIEPLFFNGGNTVKLSGNILIILFLLANTLSAVMAKRLVRKKVTSTTMANTSFIVGALTLLPTAFYLYGPEIVEIFRNIELQYHAGVFYMALISGNLAYVLWIRGQKTIEASEAALFGYLGPIFAAPLAVFWLGEKITPVFIVGAILIVTGVAFAEYKPKRASK